MGKTVALLIMGGWGCSSMQTSPQGEKRELDKVIGRLAIGMALNGADEMLKPFTLVTGTMMWGGSGRQTRYYHLRGNLQLGLTSGIIPRHEQVEEIGALQPKEKWYGLSWMPTQVEQTSALAIAEAQMRRDVAAGRRLSDLYEPDPSGLTESNEDLPMTIELEVERGQRFQFVVKARRGEFRNHRLLIIDFLRGNEWNYRVVVDMDESRVVPYRWTPSNMDVRKARVIADQRNQDFLIDPNVTRVRAWGDYDYGPLRRRVVLLYKKPSSTGGEDLRYFTVDVE